MDQAWAWLALAGLGAFHGINPAMGWLFAVALGLHRNSGGVVFKSLVPIALGHALAISLAAGALVGAGLVTSPGPLRAICGAVLIFWAVWHWRYGHRHRVRVGMKTGLVGLGIWSFLMATAHGAGLMLWPALMPICFPEGRAPAGFGGPLGAAMIGVSVHTVAMVAVTGLIAAAVYFWMGLGFLRSAWLNVDVIWIVALGITGAMLLLG